MKGILTLLIMAGIAAAYFFLPDQDVRTPGGVAAHPHHYSEAGVAYTTAYVALHLPGGVSGLAPGTRLTECLDIQVPGKEVVSNGAYTFAIEPQMLTHDLELAHDLAAADELDQGRTVSSLTRAQNQRTANTYNANLLTAQDVEQINAASVADSTVGAYGSALSRPATTVGAASGGSYGGGGYSYYDGSTVISNVTFNQYGSGGGSRGGNAGGGTFRVNSSGAAGPRYTPSLGTNGPVAAGWNTTGGQ